MREVWLGIAGLFLSLLALCFCAYLYSELRAKLSKPDITSALQDASGDAIRTLEKSFRSLETEWTDMYSKFMRLAGRMDKTKALDAGRPGPAAELEEERPLTQSEVYRRWRQRR